MSLAGKSPKEIKASIQSVIEEQRADSHSTLSTADIYSALECTFEILLDGQADCDSDLADSFETLRTICQLDGISLSRASQERLASVVHDYWSSSIPLIHSRSLLEAVLTRKSASDREGFVQALLRLLHTVSAGSKRSLHILTFLFDYTTPKDLDEQFPDLWENLLSCLHEQTGSLQGAKLLVKLALRQYRENVELLADSLSPLLVDAPPVRHLVYENVLPALLPAVPQLLPRLQPSLDSLGDADRLITWLNLTRIGLNQAIQDGDTIETVLSWSLTHQLPTVRYDSMRLLVLLGVGSGNAVKRITIRHFALHRLFWTYNLADSDSATMRTGLIGVWKDFIVRLRLSSYGAARDVKKREKAAAKDGLEGDIQLEEAREYIAAASDFATWWTEFALDQLGAMKPYRCQVNALRYLEVLLNEGIDRSYARPSEGKASKARDPILWPFYLDISSRRTFSLALLNCIGSTYEDIKTLAFELLKRCPSDRELLEQTREPAVRLIKGKRDAEIVSGTLLFRLLARDANDPQKSIIALLDICDGQMEFASRDFAAAADDAPIHGCLATLNQLLIDYPVSSSDETWSSIYNRSFELVQTTWKITCDLLCRDGENGEEDEEAGMEQVVLSAAWRAMKEAGYLLATLLSNQAQIWPQGTILEYGRIYGLWLLDIEHRGAFAHISSAYGRVCAQLVQRKDESASFPRIWLESHLDEILLKHRPTKRRSAGIPYLLLGALSGSAHSVNNLAYAFDRLFAALQPDASTSDATKSHAVNSLRVLFLDGKLTKVVKPYIERGFIVAVEGFGAKDWAIRNASLLLYASLIWRVFGTKKEHLRLSRRPSIVEFFSKYPALHPILVAELSKQVEAASAESLGSLFSTLLLLSLVHTPNDDQEATALVEPFLPYVEACAASPVWMVREAAAAALTGLVSPDQTWEYCEDVVRSLGHAKEQNSIHGKLLQLQHLLSTASTAIPKGFGMLGPPQIGPLNDAECPDLAEEIARPLSSYINVRYSLPIRTASLRLVQSLSTHPQAVASLWSDRLSTSELVQRSTNRPGEATWQRALVSASLDPDSGRTAHLLPVVSVAAQNQMLENTLATGICRTPAQAESILSVCLSPASDAGNAYMASQALLLASDSALAGLDVEAVQQLRSATTAKDLKEALLPLIVRMAAVQGKETEVQVLMSEINGQAESESASARRLACEALSHVPVQSRRSFDCLWLLTRFLQDEDADIRSMATSITTANFNDGQPTQSTRAVDLVWKQICQTATSDNISSLSDKYVADAQEKLDAIDEQASVLFAVERTNVFADLAVDFAWARELVQKRDKPLQIDMARLASLQARLQEKIGDNAADQPLGPLGSYTYTEIMTCLDLVQSAA